MPAHKEEEIMELRRAFYMGGLLRRWTVVQLSFMQGILQALVYLCGGLFSNFLHLGFCLGLRHFGGSVSEGLVLELRNFALADSGPSRIPNTVLYLMRWFDVYFMFRAQRSRRDRPQVGSDRFFGTL